MREIALHMMDIAENSISAGATRVIIRVAENTVRDRLKISIEDNGRGMDDELVARVIDPFVTSRTTRRVGLGIPLLKAAAEACNGYLRINSALGKGTRLEVEFQRSHIDRMPLGDVAGTMLSLMVGSPQIHWVFQYSVDGNVYEFDDAPVKQELEGVSLTEPAILTFLRESLQDGVASVQVA
jgi:anti-sigma regulatory factor (Ser/Thr protein kinase)